MNNIPGPSAAAKDEVKYCAVEEIHLQPMLPLSESPARRPFVFVATIPSLISKEQLVRSQDVSHIHAGVILAACTGSGETIMVDLPSARDLLPSADDDSADSPWQPSACFFDAEISFAAPLRAFIAGSFRARVVPGDDSGNAEEPCLIYVLGTGEILVFHSIAEQVGFGPIGSSANGGNNSEMPSELRRLALYDPAAAAAIKSLALSEDEQIQAALRCNGMLYRQGGEGEGSGGGGGDDDPTRFAAALRWATDLPSEELRRMQSEVEHIKKQLADLDMPAAP